MRTPVFHSYPSWLRLSGVNAWSVNLAKASQEDPYFEHLVLFTGGVVSPVSELHRAGITHQDLNVPPSRGRNEEWRALKRFLGSNSPCIYLPNYDFHRASVAGALPPNVRVCSVVHSDEDCYYDQLARVGRACNAIVAVSEQIGKNVHERFPELAGRVHYIPYGVPQPLCRVKHKDDGGPIRLAYCNRLAQYQKRVFDLPEICRELARLGTDFHLTIAGEGPDERELKAKFEAAGLAVKVAMTGRLDADGVANVLSASHVFLLTSDFEGLPVSLLEAMACGCVPVVYNIASGVRDAVENGVNGMLTSYGDPVAMASAIRHLDSDRNLLSRLSFAAEKTHAEKFSVQRMAADYRKLFSNLMQEQQGGVRRDGRIRRPRDLKLYFRILRRIGLVPSQL